MNVYPRSTVGLDNTRVSLYCTQFEQQLTADVWLRPNDGLAWSECWNGVRLQWLAVQQQHKSVCGHSEPRRRALPSIHVALVTY